MVSSRLKPADIWENVLLRSRYFVVPPTSCSRFNECYTSIDVYGQKRFSSKKFNTKGNFDRTPRKNL